MCEGPSFFWSISSGVRWANWLSLEWRGLQVVVAVGVQSISHAWHFAAPWTTACLVPLTSTISWSLLKFLSIESVILSNHLMLCHPMLLWPSIFLSIRVFSNESALRIRWPNYWSFIFSISPSNEYSRLISFRIDLFPLGPPCSPRDSQMTTGKAIALTTWTFVCKIVFLPRSKHLWISWQSWSEVTLGPKENKIYHCFHFSPFFLPWGDGTGCHDLSFLNVELQASFSLSSFTLT